MAPGGPGDAKRFRYKPKEAAKRQPLAIYRLIYEGSGACVITLAVDGDGNQLVSGTGSVSCFVRHDGLAAQTLAGRGAYHISVGVNGAGEQDDPEDELWLLGLVGE